MESRFVGLTMTPQLQPLSETFLKKISKSLMQIGHRHQKQWSIDGFETFAVSEIILCFVWYSFWSCLFL